MLPKFSYVRATSVGDGVRALSAPGARLHAGGTDLLGCLREGVFKADKVVSLAGLSALRGISAPPTGGLRLGAMTTLAEVVSNRQVLAQYPVLAQAAASVGSPQLRNQGTLGGNLCQRPRCWYFRGDFQCLRKGGDTCYAVGGENQHHAIFGGRGCYMVHPSDTAVALVALGARVRITGPGGARTVPLSAFFVLPDKDVLKETVLAHNEVVTDILLPPVEAGTKSGYRKVRSRGSWDFALASAAMVVTTNTAGVVTRARIVLGAAAPSPWRAEGAEKAIVGSALTADVAARAAEAAVKGAETLSQNGYKVALFCGVVEEQLLAMAQSK
jgi:xanthine dehydrogenase YagS FAD-binding subunit